MAKLKHILATIRSRLAFPLLAKELIEQSNRKRTYVLRTVYAVLMFFFSALFLYTFFDRIERYGGSAYNLLGRGREMFFVLISFQFTGLFLFLPAMVSGVITHEKERQSLQLLLITDLRPWEIIFQKLAGRLIPMVTFLLLSLPLMAVAYSFGGVTANRVNISILLLALSLLQVGGAAILCSAYARSTAAAFLLTYLLLALLYFGPALIGLLLEGWRVDENVVFAFCPLFHLGEGLDRDRAFGDVFMRSIPVMFTIPLLLILARVCLTKRANVPPRNAWLALFGAMDRFFEKLNKAFGGVNLFKNESTLPQYAPLAWRETTKKGLGKPQYLIRILVLIEVPVLLVVTGMIASRGGYSRNADELSAMLGFLWPITALIFCVAASNLFVTERARQTLDLLLTTPMTSSQILWQKMAGLRRLMWVMLVPFATVFFVEAWWESGSAYRYGYSYRGDQDTFLYLLSSFLSYFIYIPMITWLAVLLSMRTKSQARAIMTSVGVLVGWCLAPLFLLVLLDELFRWRIWEEGPIPMLIASPVSIVPLMEFDDLGMRGGNAWASVFVNFFWYGAILLVMRVLCYYNADRWLGRVRGLDHNAQSFVAVEPMADKWVEKHGENRADGEIDLDPKASLTHNEAVEPDLLEEVDGPPLRDSSTPPPLPPDSEQPKDHAP